MKTLLKILVVLITVLVSFVARAQEGTKVRPNPTLRVGEPAPALAPGQWLKGEAVKKFESGKVYVVEFWATWCPPCRASIPHLSELQAKYKDVVIIGQDCMEKKPEAVAEFVKKMGEKMDYRVALDDTSKENEGIMVKSWLKAAAANGIPTAFLVGKGGTIEWIGHPMELDKVLPKVLNGTFNHKQYAEEQAKRRAAEAELNSALRAQDYSRALKLVDDFVSQYPETAAELSVLKFQLLLAKKDFAAAYTLAEEFPKTCKDKPEILNAMAWMIATANGLEKRNLDVALRLATAANEVSNAQNPQFLDTLARIHFEKGQVEKAVEYAAQALAKAPPAMKEELEATLKRYKENQEKKGN